MPLQGVQHVLAPVDFSDLSALGLRYAASLAQCAGARLSVLYADPFQPPPYFTASRIAAVKDEIEHSKEQARAALEEFVRAHLGSEAKIRIQVEEGLPADVIRRVAAQSPADLIVMGTHGRSGVNRLLLGSVTERVLREARVPVLVVRGDWQPREIRRILCPVNDSPAGRQALQAATDLARCLGAEVHVVHVKQAGQEGTIQDLCAWIPESQRPLCTATALDYDADVAQEVIRVAGELKVDLLVMGARHRPFSDTTVLGANTIRILRHAPSPVLAVFER